MTPWKYLGREGNFFQVLGFYHGRDMTKTVESDVKTLASFIQIWYCDHVVECRKKACISYRHHCESSNWLGHLN